MNMVRPLKFHDIVLSNSMISSPLTKRSKSLWSILKNSIKKSDHSIRWSILDEQKGTQMSFALNLPEKIQRDIRKAEKRGKKVRLFIPQTRVPSIIQSMT